MTEQAPLQVLVRPYSPDDRARVREICFLTGYMGEPVDWQWRDEESFADMFTGYYTDVEPESAFVAEVDGEVSGYLLGCVDSHRAWTPGSVAGRHILRRGIALRPGTAAVIWRTFGDALADIVTGRTDPRKLEFSDPRWPAHLHIDLLPHARGHGIGRRLMDCWFARLRAHRVTGCHLGTLGENTGAIAFFESVSFRRHGPALPIPGPRRREGGRLHSQIMVTEIEPLTPTTDG